MAKDTGTQYGPNNVRIEDDGTDLVIRVRKDIVLKGKEAGSPNASGKARVWGLCATTGGFDNISGHKVSVNVSIPPTE